MPKFRCDFDVIGDLVLPTTAEQPLTITLPSGATVELSNGDRDEQEHTKSLIAKVVGEAPSIRDAERVLRTLLAEQLDLMCFTTQSRFKIEGARRAIDWEPNKRHRPLLVYQAVDARYPPSPELSEAYCKTCETLESMNFPPFIRLALKYFRYGCLDQTPEDQFMRFWLALEIVAENTKPKERAPIVCASCAKNAKCAHCGFEPSRVPMATEAIRLLIDKITAPRKDVSERQLTVRHGLMHGRTPAAMEAKVGVGLPAIVNEVAELTWNAIFAHIITRPERENDAPLDFGHFGGQFVGARLVVVAELLVDTGEGEYPTEDKLPKVETEILHRFNGP
jgi:hypothetical protein